MQLKHAISHQWKRIIKQNPGNVNSSRPEVLEHLRWLLLDVINILIQDHRLIKRARTLTLEKLSSKELYSVLVTKFANKHSSNVYFEKIFPNMKFNWRKIYVLLCITTINTYLLSLQHKILDNILFLNKKIFIFRMKNTPLCYFRSKEEGKPLHIYSKCTSVIYL